MTLRRRLELALALLVVTLVVGAVAVLAVQRAFVQGQVDAQLRDLGGAPGPLLGLARRADAGLPRVQAPTDVYVGRIDRRGRLTTLLSPADDLTLVPDLSADAPRVRPGTPTTVPTVTGRATQARVLTVALPRGGRAVLAVPTTRADAVVSRLTLAVVAAGLLVAAVTALLVWWVVRLGLRPIAAMTAAADEVTAGRVRPLSDPGPPGTEVARLGRALDTMVAARTEAQERLERFVADASHELRTPLTTILGYSSSGVTAGSGVAPEDALRRIHEESARMRRLLDQLLALSTQARVPPEDRRSVDLERLLHDVADDLRVVQPERPVDVQVAPGLTAWADPDLLHQAVASLAANALQHTPRTAAVTLEAATVRADGAEVLVGVRDAGPGIAAEHLPHLTERFFRVDPSRSRHGGGSGLGLAVVEAVARAHDGALLVASEPGGGSAFTLRLAAAPPAQD